MPSPLTVADSWAAVVGAASYALQTGQGAAAGEWLLLAAVHAPLGRANTLADSAGNTWILDGGIELPAGGGAGPPAAVGVGASVFRCVLTHALAPGDVLAFGATVAAIEVFRGTGMAPTAPLAARTLYAMSAYRLSPAPVHRANGWVDSDPTHPPQLVFGVVVFGYPGTDPTPHEIYVPDDVPWSYPPNFLAPLGQAQTVRSEPPGASTWYSLRGYAAGGAFAVPPVSPPPSDNVTLRGTAYEDLVFFNHVDAAHVYLTLTFAYRPASEANPRVQAPGVVGELGRAFSRTGSLSIPVPAPIPAGDRLIVAAHGPGNGGRPVTDSQGNFYAQDNNVFHRLVGSGDTTPVLAVWSADVVHPLGPGDTIDLVSYPAAIALQARRTARGGGVRHGAGADGSGNPNPNPYLPDPGYFLGAVGSDEYQDAGASFGGRLDSGALLPRRDWALLLGAAVVTRVPAGPGTTLTPDDPAWTLLPPLVETFPGDPGFDTCLFLGWRVVPAGASYRFSGTLRQPFPTTFLPHVETQVAYSGLVVGTAPAGLWCLHDPVAGGYHVAAGGAGAITYYRAENVLPPFGLAAPGPAGAEPRMVYLALPHQPLWLVFARAAGIYYAVSADDGETWSTPVSVIPGGKHPTLAHDADSGDLLVAGYVETDATAQTGELHGVYRAPGDAGFGSVFAFRDPAGVPLAVADDTFHFSPAPEAARRWVLVCRLASAPAGISVFASPDDGQTWSPA